MAIQIGDLVSVTGKVSEYAFDGMLIANNRHENTQINVRDDQGGNVTVIESGVALPAPIIIDEDKMPTTYR